MEMVVINVSKIKCNFCGKNISAQDKVCPKCHRFLTKPWKLWFRMGLCFLWFLTQLFLVILICCFEKEFFYSEYMRDLVVLGLLVGVLFINSIIGAISVYKIKMKKILTIIGNILAIGFSIFALVYSYKIAVAIRYDNSAELLALSDIYDVKTAKELKTEIESIFEYDYDDTFSRDVIISNFYTDGQYSNLYIDDFYGNYRLKFYVDMDNFKIKDIYWDFDNKKLYLVSNGEKTENFEYYYAMCIVDNVIGEDIRGLTRLDKAIEDVISGQFEVSANAMFNYEELEYNDIDNTFTLKGDVYNMDYYGGMNEETFVVTFNNRDDANNKHIWYYGDASFDYVNWDVKK